MSHLTYGANSAFARPADALDDGAPGLTKREYFAAAALQGLLASIERVAQPCGKGVMLSETFPYDSEKDMEELLASSAVAYADALIDALNSPRQEWKTEAADDAGTEWEHEPNREALAVEAHVEPEGRWGDE